MKKILFLLSNFMVTTILADLKMYYVDISDFKVQSVHDEALIIQDIKNMSDIKKYMGDAEEFVKDLTEGIKEVKEDRESIHYLFIVKNKLDVCGFFMGRFNEQEVARYNDFFESTDEDEDEDEDLEELEMLQEFFERHPMAVCKVDFIFINSTYRRQGIATKLLKIFEELSKKAGCVKSCITYIPVDSIMEQFILKNGYKLAFKYEYEVESGVSYINYMMKDL